jgi:hypothetical protein
LLQFCAGQPCNQLFLFSNQNFICRGKSMNDIQQLGLCFFNCYSCHIKCSFSHNCTLTYSNSCLIIKTSNC